MEYNPENKTCEYDLYWSLFTNKFVIFDWEFAAECGN